MKYKKRVIFSRHPKNKTRVDLDPKGTTHHGFWGLYEIALRRFKTVVYLLTILPLYFLCSLLMGLCFIPGVKLYQYIDVATTTSSEFMRYFSLGTAVATGFFLYGFSLVLVIPTTNFLLRAKPKVFRGPYYSIDFLQWYVHNALTYLMRYTFLEFITPTPFNLLFFRLMGMKIGHGTQLNTSNVSDPALIEIGDRVTVGGSVTLCAHYGMGGFLILAPVRIGNNVTLGLKSSSWVES
ncbi:MAG: hypothetical protein KA715_09365 [Xanthomonadaceae bacterium]|nr:hypothetical protein [Xanthomonadaceae bacterium]